MKSFSNKTLPITVEYGHGQVKFYIGELLEMATDRTKYWCLGEADRVRLARLRNFLPKCVGMKLPVLRLECPRQPGRRIKKPLVIYSIALPFPSSRPGAPNYGALIHCGESDGIIEIIMDKHNIVECSSFYYEHIRRRRYIVGVTPYDTWKRATCTDRNLVQNDLFNNIHVTGGDCMPVIQSSLRTFINRNYSQDTFKNTLDYSQLTYDVIGYGELHLK